MRPWRLLEPDEVFGLGAMRDGERRRGGVQRLLDGPNRVRLAQRGRLTAVAAVAAIDLEERYLLLQVLSLPTHLLRRGGELLRRRRVLLRDLVQLRHCGIH